MTNEEFDKEVLASELPVLVDFGADWCGPCRHMEPIIDELAINSTGKLLVIKVNTDKAQEVATRFNINAVPTFIAFKNGTEVGRLMGIQTANKLKEMCS